MGARRGDDDRSYSSVCPSQGPPPALWSFLNGTRAGPYQITRSPIGRSRHNVTGPISVKKLVSSVMQVQILDVV